jgi:hypothetical protein
MRDLLKEDEMVKRCGGRLRRGEAAAGSSSETHSVLKQQQGCA